MSSLYELSEQYEYLQDMLQQIYEERDHVEMAGVEDPETVDQQTILDTLEGIDGEIEEKADNIAKMIMNNKSRIEALKKEEERLCARRKACENSLDFLKKYLQGNLEFIGKTKFKTTLFSFSIAKNGGKQPLYVTENLDEIPGKYLIPQPPKVNTDAVRKLLEDKEVEWAHLEQRGKSLRIR